MAAICGMPEEGHRASQEMPAWLAQHPTSEAHGRETETNCHVKNLVRGTDLVS